MLLLKSTKFRIRWLLTVLGSSPGGQRSGKGGRCHVGGRERDNKLRLDTMTNHKRFPCKTYTMKLSFILYNKKIDCFCAYTKIVVSWSKNCSATKRICCSFFYKWLPPPPQKKKNGQEKIRYSGNWKKNNF